MERWIAWLGLLLVCGCSTSTLTSSSGLKMEGELQRADDEHVYIELDVPETEADVRGRRQATEVSPSEAERSGKRIHRVRRSEIAEVSYPGTAGIAVGAVMMGASLVPAAVGTGYFADCGGEGLCGFYLVFIAGPGVIVAGLGTIPLVLGLVRRNHAEEIMNGEISEVGGWRLSPLIVPQSEGGAAGLSASTSW